MSAKPTPGPWKLLPLEEGAEYLRIRGTLVGRRFKVCNVHAPFQYIGREVLESQANARLIAAAPDLLEALELIAGTDPIDAALDPQRAIRVARAAIAKAEGKE